MSAVWEQRTIHALDEGGMELVANLAPLPERYISFSIIKPDGQAARVQLTFAQAEEFGLLLVAMARQKQPEFK